VKFFYIYTKCYNGMILFEGRLVKLKVCVINPTAITLKMKRFS
jgi:hypothetical protein